MALRTELLQLHRQFATTMVYVTHDPAEAMMMSTQLFVMRDGVIEQAGTPDQLYHSPYNRFVAESIGWPAMSFLSGSSPQGTNSQLSVLERIAASHSPSQQVDAIARHELTLGVRASQWHASRLEEKLPKGQADRNSQIAFEAVVDLVLPLGEKDLLETIVGTDKVQVLVDPRQFHPGDRLTLAVGVSSIQLFNRKTGETIREKR
jgi:multiple sugar transport system ATP-binding protein